MQFTGPSRIDRMEKEIEDLRRTQTRILLQLEFLIKTPGEKLDALTENLPESKAAEDRELPPLPSLHEVKERLRERNDFHRENRAILLAIAKHLGVKIDNFDTDSQPD